MAISILLYERIETMDVGSAIVSVCFGRIESAYIKPDLDALSVINSNFRSSDSPIPAIIISHLTSVPRGKWSASISIDYLNGQLLEAVPQIFFRRSPKNVEANGSSEDSFYGSRIHVGESESPNIIPTGSQVFRAGGGCRGDANNGHRKTKIKQRNFFIMPLLY